MSQSNTRTGDLMFTAGVDLTGKEGRVVWLFNDNGEVRAHLPTLNEHCVAFILVDGGPAGSPVTVRPLDGSRNVRAVLKGSCVAGGLMVLADPTVEADRGKLRAMPPAVGTYRVVGIAEESGADGQLVLVRPAQLGNFTVTD